MLACGEINKGVKAVAVIMAGGGGTRFWPLSRAAYPKQYLKFGSDRTLIQQTYDRVKKLNNSNIGIAVVTTKDQLNLVKQQLPGVAVIVEPSGRNTAACVALAAEIISRIAGDVPMVVLPADHVIVETDNLNQCLEAAILMASTEDAILTIGIKPTSAETGYGYIEAGLRVSPESAERKIYIVKKFVEKPSLEIAKGYLNSGNFFWNSGMFVFRSTVIKDRFMELAPEIYKGVVRVVNEHEDSRKADLYKLVESVSVDVAIMERSRGVFMIPGDDFIWSDIGSWSSFFETLKLVVTTGEGSLDENHNQLIGNVLALNSKNCGVHSTKRFVSCLGLSDIIIVDTDDALLVCNRNETQDVKKIVEFLKANKMELL